MDYKPHTLLNLKNDKMVSATARIGRRFILVVFGACILSATYLFVEFSADTLSYHPKLSKYLAPIESGLKNVVPINFTHIPSSFSEDQLEDHHYREDGLLEVNPQGPHPIYELMERSQRTWDSRLRRASRTLQDAVREYRRRYRRPPPKGFNHWWDYVVTHNIQLPDEYDSIHDQLEHYWAVKPADLAQLQQQWESHRDTYTVGKVTEGDPITVLGTSMTNETLQHDLNRLANGQLNLIKDVQQFIPPFRAIFTASDNPNQLTDHNIEAMANQAITEGTYIDIHHLPSVNTDGWGAGCPPGSPLRAGARLMHPNDKTFIYDQQLSMDVCRHPENVHLHGAFLQYNTTPVPEVTLVPQFSPCTTKLHRDITVPSLDGWTGDVDNVSWEEKVDDRLLWRGPPSDVYHSPDTTWVTSHRPRLVNHTNTRDGVQTFLPPTNSSREPVGFGREVKSGDLNMATMDIGFTGDFAACASAACNVIRESFEVKDSLSPDTSALYKFVIDVDSHGFSTRFKRLMSSNSVVFRSTVYSHWFTERLAPWVHYVPVQIDYSDLHDAVIFFRGDINGEGAHDQLARKIADAGKSWSETFWRKEDMTAYLFR
ncbi:hypothetical protein BD410DRAFT_8683 [Rickenella mellea]|uniref:Glycosyl transferase CAP10 domain-containing protein n=1 Tax=Rickenella mellea TaxID=50990 RepID=A0A4R5XDR2_9AGAM|nr:hypothetical protein BD410DRAFT_8683 [Rickenella mellea]